MAMGPADAMHDMKVWLLDESRDAGVLWMDEEHGSEGGSREVRGAKDAGGRPWSGCLTQPLHTRLSAVRVFLYHAPVKADLAFGSHPIEQGPHPLAAMLNRARPSCMLSPSC